MTDFTRNPFRIHVELGAEHLIGDDIARQATAFPSDYVIQVSMNKASFTSLFKDVNMATGPYNAENLKTRLISFWEKGVNNNNYKTFANSLFTLVMNEYQDVDINTVNLELSTQSNYEQADNNSEIFKYFHISNTTIKHDDANQTPLKVYEAMAAELGTLLTNIAGDPNNTDPFESLENQYGYEEFWNTLQNGDSLFIEGSLQLPTESSNSQWLVKEAEGEVAAQYYTAVGGANLPCILRFMVNEEEPQYSWST